MVARLVAKDESIGCAETGAGAAAYLSGRRAARPGRVGSRSLEDGVMRKRLIAGFAGSLVLVLAFASTTLGASAERRVTLLDDCNAATFNAVLGPGACVKDGGVTFEDFIGQLIATGNAPAWRNAPAQLHLDAGGSIDAYNRGGEFHTFTEVAAFGGGCVDELNQILGLTPVPECAIPGIFGATGVAPHEELEGAPLSSGVHLFECLIHPWMRTVATVD
jgi:hypothetical protein